MHPIIGLIAFACLEDIVHSAWLIWLISNRALVKLYSLKNGNVFAHGVLAFHRIF